MSWQQWLSRGDLKPHQSSKQELDNMRALITRDIADAAIQALSEDRRFATAAADRKCLCGRAEACCSLLNPAK